MFVVFDEFGKYIEGHNLQGYENDMKVLQDMCELGVKTDEPQFHLTMVTHKSIKEYGNTVDKRIMDGFMGIEGRIREIYYVDSVQNHYEMIASVLKKDKNLFRQEVIDNDNSGYTLNLKNGYKNAYFRSIFSEKEFDKIEEKLQKYVIAPVSVELQEHVDYLSKHSSDMTNEELHKLIKDKYHEGAFNMLYGNKELALALLITAPQDFVKFIAMYLLAFVAPRFKKDDFASEEETRIIISSPKPEYINLLNNFQMPHEMEDFVEKVKSFVDCEKQRPDNNNFFREIFMPISVLKRIYVKKVNKRQAVEEILRKKGFDHISVEIMA